MDINKKQATSACDYKSGRLPECGALAVPYIPFQGQDPTVYSNDQALNHGTLFKGLDLPLFNNFDVTNVVDSDLTKLMATSFAIYDLGLYLDTHADDKAALKKYTSLVKEYNTQVAAYTSANGPLQQTQVTDNGYTWLKNPWPWNYCERTGE